MLKRIFLCSIILGIFVSCFENTKIKKHDLHQKVFINNKEYTLKFAYAVKKQYEYARKIENIKPKYLFTIGNGRDTLLCFPIRIIEKNNNIYVLDQGSYSVKVFTDSGKFIEKKGAYGKGPGEFLLPIDFDVSESGKIIVLDARLFRITIFDDSLTTILNFSEFLHGVRFSSESDFLILKVEQERGISFLQKIDFKGNKLIDCQNIFEKHSFDIPPMNSSLQGEVFTSRNNIIFVPYFFNHFVVFFKNGKFKYCKEKVDKVEIPYITFKSLKGGAIFSDAKYLKKFQTTQTAFIKNHVLYNYTELRIGKKRDCLIDLYNLSNGNYLKSFKFKIKGSLIRTVFSKNRIFIIRPDGSIDVYRVNYGE